MSSARAIAATASEIPPQWIEGATRLRGMSLPAAVPNVVWTALLAATARFIAGGWTPEAAALGWSALDLWGCHPERPAQRLDLAGALWLIGADDVTAIGGFHQGQRPWRRANRPDT